MATRAGVFLMVLLISGSLQRETKSRLIVWNVGQGQWVTLVREDGCWHFDAGGEQADWKRVMRDCRERPNFLWLSHWDWDHIGFAGRMRGLLPQLCRLPLPPGEPAKNKLRIVERIEPCSDSSPFVQWRPLSAGRANDLSQVAWVEGTLIPGDSPSARERLWIRELPQVAQTRLLVLGHHGSRTSTSLSLLSRMKSLRMAVASARRERYGHPHREVEARLRARRVPLLRTQDWGHLEFGL